MQVQFKGLTKADLKRDATMYALLQHAIERHWISDTRAARFDFWCYVEHSLRLGKNPGAMLSWLVQNRKVDYITNEDEARVLARRVKF